MQSQTTPKKPTVCILGGGAAGYFCAINSARKHPHKKIILLEATQRPLSKVKISGGGRCNVTHYCFDPKELVKNYPRGFKELLGPFHRFQPQDTVEWFRKEGVPLKAEADGRMFPVTDNSQTVIDALTKAACAANVEIRKGALVKGIQRQESGFLLRLQKDEQTIQVDQLVLATGSTPMAYDLVQAMGHTIIKPVPSLFTFNIEDPILEGLMGTSFRVSLSLEIANKTFKQKGPLLITHWGVSGPAVLKLSAFAARELFETDYRAKLLVHWVEGITKEEVLTRLQAERKTNPKQRLSKHPLFELTTRFWLRVLELAKIEPDLTWGNLGNEALDRVKEILTNYPLTVAGKGVFKEEFVTSGGVALAEVNFKTMESKIVKDLFFAGELLDVDGITGGFNFQNAWTTGWIISESL